MNLLHDMSDTEKNNTFYICFCAADFHFKLEFEEVIHRLPTCFISLSWIRATDTQHPIAGSLVLPPLVETGRGLVP